MQAPGQLLLTPPSQPLLQQQQQQQQQQYTAPMVTYPAGRRPTFRRLSARHTEFQVGFGGLFLSALLFIVGYSAPAWSSWSGLWQECPRNSNCRSIMALTPDWMESVRTVETIALGYFLICMAVALYAEVLKSPPPLEDLAVEMLAALAAGYGLSGAAIYWLKVRDRCSYYDGAVHCVETHLSWGYWLCVAGSCTVLICAILIIHSRIKHAAQTYLAMVRAGVPTAAKPMFVPVTCLQPPAHPIPVQQTATGKTDPKGAAPNEPGPSLQPDVTAQTSLSPAYMIMVPGGMHAVAVTTFPEP